MTHDVFSGTLNPTQSINLRGVTIQRLAKQFRPIRSVRVYTGCVQAITHSLS